MILWAIRKRGNSMMSMVRRAFRMGDLQEQVEPISLTFLIRNSLIIDQKKWSQNWLIFKSPFRRFTQDVWRKCQSLDTEYVLIVMEREEAVYRSVMLAKETESQWEWFNLDLVCILKLRLVAKNVTQLVKSLVSRLNAKVVMEKE